MNEDERERMQIRDAMGRLLEGHPIRSDGKLTVKSLAAEAGVKRWLLTHKHKDLQVEFRDRVRLQGSLPDPTRALVAENNELERRLKRSRTDLRRALARTQRYARVVQVLELEKRQLEHRLSQYEPRLSSLRPGVPPSSA